MTDEHVLDQCIWASLANAHSALADGTRRARRYRPEVSPFAGLRDADDGQAWLELADLLGPGDTVALMTETADRAPTGWRRVFALSGVQLVPTDRFHTEPDPDAVALGADDVPEMVDLVRRTEPGPFRPETYRMGRYLGLRHDGRLVAMAGERLHPPGWTEISAVCTDPEFRGQGLAARLIRAVGHGIRARSEQPVLHVAGANTQAIALYRRLGFEHRRPIEFIGLQPDLSGVPAPGWR